MYLDRFERPTNHYDGRIEKLDEEICALIAKRKKNADGTPGFPTEDLIRKWVEKYELPEDFLHGLFGHLFAEDLYGAMIEPKGFIKNIHVLQSFEQNDLLFVVPFIKQYENASVVQLTVDCDVLGSEETNRFEHQFFNQTFTLSIHDKNEEQFTSHQIGGGGTDSHMAVQYVVTPPLPEDLSMIQLAFVEGNPQNQENQIAWTIQL